MIVVFNCKFQLLIILFKIMDIIKDFYNNKVQLEDISSKDKTFELELRFRNINKYIYEKIFENGEIKETVEKIYEIKGKSNVTLKCIGDKYLTKEIVSSEYIKDFDSKIVLSIERSYKDTNSKKFLFNRHKIRTTKKYKGFLLDKTKIIENNEIKYELELEIYSLDNLKEIQTIIDKIKELSNSFSLSSMIKRRTKNLDIKNYRFPKPVDATIADIIKYFSKGGSMSYKINGRRYFVILYDNNIYDISTLNRERVIREDIKLDINFTVLDTEYLDGKYHIFDVIIYNNKDINNIELKQRIKYIPKICLKLNNIVKERLFLVKQHFFFYDYNGFIRAHDIIKCNQEKLDIDGLILTCFGNYFSRIFRWKPIMTVDFKYNDEKIFLLNKGKDIEKNIRVENLPDKIKNGDVLECSIISKDKIRFERIRKDKTYPNPLNVYERMLEIYINKYNNIFNEKNNFLEYYHKFFIKELIDDNTNIYVIGNYLKDLKSDIKSRKKNICLITDIDVENISNINLYEQIFILYIKNKEINNIDNLINNKIGNEFIISDRKKLKGKFMSDKELVISSKFEFMIINKK